MIGLLIFILGLAIAGVIAYTTVIIFIENYPIN
jgi:hypothetical protein